MKFKTVVLCLKLFAQMLEKEFPFAKFRLMILNVANIHKNLAKKLTLNVLIFKIVLKDRKMIIVSNIEHKYEPFRERNLKLNAFLSK